MSQVDHSKMLRNVSIASVVGATIEWYDFFLYGVVAGIVFNKLYCLIIYISLSGLGVFCITQKQKQTSKHHPVQLMPSYPPFRSHIPYFSLS